MASRLREFVAEDLWLLIGLVTLVLLSFAGLAGFEAFAGVIAIIGWFLLTPIFLFWGEEIAALVAGDNDDPPEPATRATEPDALEELKRRYAEGTIDDDEFEHRLERLVAVDDLPADIFGGSASPDAAADDRLEAEGDRREYEWER